MEGVHPDDRERCLAIYTAAFDTRDEFSMIYRLRRHDGAYRYVLDKGRPYRTAAGEFAGFLRSCIDVTEVHEAQERLRYANDEKAVLLLQKERLLREVHHRVRNNMQLITSILGLQVDAASSRDARESLKIAAARVRALAMAQERLYASDAFAEPDLADYLNSLVAGTHLLGTRDDIRVELDCEPVPLDLAITVPLGLVVNELLMNAVKHAFPQGRQGSIQVRGQAAAERIEISIRDDGIGLPAHAPEGLGLRLVRRLVGQLAADLTRTHDQGVHYRLSVPRARRG